MKDDREGPPAPPEEPVEISGEIVHTPELYSQVHIAKSFPRDLSKVTARALKMATIDQETAQGCFYTLKRKDRRTREIKKIQGPSIRLAEIVVHCFGNFRWGGRMVREEATRVVCQGGAHDLEANTHCLIEVSRRITTSDGRRYGDDMVAVTTMAAIAICLRNAAFKNIPAYLWKPVYEAAIDKAVGDASTLADRRQKMVAAFAKMGVAVEKILGYVEKKTLDEIGLEDLQDLIGVFTAIRDGEQTVDDAFGTAQAAEEEGPKSKAEGTKPTATTAPPTDPPKKPSVMDQLEQSASSEKLLQCRKILGVHGIEPDLLPKDVRDGEAMVLITAGSSKKRALMCLNEIRRIRGLEVVA